MTDDRKDRHLAQILGNLETHFARVAESSPGFGKLKDSIHGVLEMPGPFEGEKKQKALQLNVILTRVGSQHADREEIKPLVAALPLITRNLAG